MTLKEKINQDLKDAMKSGDKVRLQTIRSIRAVILEFEKSGTGKEFDESEEIKLLSTAAKKRKESIEQFRKGGREELAITEEAELKVIMEYLPKQLESDEIESIIRNISEQTGSSTKDDFGKLMGASMKELKGKADGNIVKQLVKKVLS
ncbi:GatB/YqeY domain-containing protein [Bacteroidota bacterium]